MTIKKSDLLDLKDMLSDLEIDLEETDGLASRLNRDKEPYPENPFLGEYIKHQLSDTLRTIRLVRANVEAVYNDVDDMLDSLEEE